MPSNASIPTKATGNVLAAGDWNDLVPLNNTIGLFGASGAPLVGTLPATTAPNFYMQMGYVSGTSNGSGALSFFFPSAFPNGLMVVDFVQHFGTGGSPFYNAGLLDGSASLSGGQAVFWSSTTTTTTVQASVAVTGRYIAIGW